MTDLRIGIADLSPEKRMLLDRRLREINLLPARESAISPRDRSTPCRLSFAQQRLWFLDQAEPNNCVYNIARAWRLRGSLHAQALRRALDAIVGRHETLRTTIDGGSGDPLQSVAERWSVELPVMDLSSVPDAHREAELARVLCAEARRPFNLASDLMLRAVLVRLGEREHVLLLTVHHIASDGWSVGILTRELGALYGAISEGRVPGLPPLPIQYGDYAVWQRHWLQGDALEMQLAYWRGRLAGKPPTLELPTDRRRPAARTYVGAQEATVLPRGLTDALHALSRGKRMTLFMTLMAAFQTLLHRYTGQEDIVLGSAVAGRRRVETEPLVGFFVNTLVLRGDLSGNPSFRELLERVRETVLGAYDHQDLPLEKLVEEVRPERSLSWTPLFNVMFVLQDPDQPRLVLPGLTASPVEVDTGTAKFDLTASVTDTPRGLAVELEYNTDLYDLTTIKRMLGHYETLLNSVVADPEQRLSNLRLLPDAERRLLQRWNETRRSYPKDRSIPELFEAQVARTPAAIAVVAAERTATYAELNSRANQLAHHLRGRGVGPDTAVGICLKPSFDMIVGVLGILKAGGAYVPLDPTYPKERLAFMLEDAQAVALVTRHELLEVLPAVSVPIVSLNAGPLTTESTGNPAHETTGDNLAYLMYTSGSTGRPKAVAVPHRGVTRLVLNTDYVTITPSDAMAQASNVSFDAATFEIWGALLNGARLVVLTRETVLAPAELSAELERHGVTTLFLTTALFNQMARELPSAFRRIRTLLFGGETASPQCVDLVLKHGAPGRLLNAYGPTEATTFASSYLVDSVPKGAASIPIGRPIANTEIHLLDSQLNPVPIGVPGEIHIGGPGVARGYVLRPELTRDKFIPDPFSGEPGARLYKTGDLARYLTDGNIDFLGRMDEQVKLRGHRIEPGEIEAVLLQHPGIREAIVLAREDKPGDKRLVAYLVPARTPVGMIDDLHGFLKGRLPPYMIPAHFMMLDTLPLTPNGKVDRRELPPPKDAPPQRGDYTEPASPLEHQLVQIWEELLAVQPIGTRDDFFELGGHSLLAVRMINAIEHTVGQRLPLSSLFAGATIQNLAQALLGQAAGSFWSPVAATHADGSRRPFFFLHGDFNGGGFYCLKLSQALSPAQPLYALHPHGLDERPVPASIEAMAVDHLATVRALQPRGPYLLGGHCNGGLIAFEMARRLQAQGERVDFLVLMDAFAPKTWHGPRILRVFVDSFGIRQHSNPHLRDYLALSRRKARRAGEALVRLVRRLGNPASARWPSRRSSPTPDAARFRSESLEQTYSRAIMSYIPRRYPGRITLFRSEENPEGQLDLGWRRVASEVEVHMVPGNHLTSLTRHVGALGERLSACLQTVQMK